MTNEEAIKILEECLGQGQFFDSRLKQAYDKALEALKKEVLVEKMKKAYYKELKREADDKVLQSLCKSCKKYDDCSDSTKISPNFYLLRCRKYEEADNDQTN